MVRTTLLHFLVDDAMMQLLSTHTNARTTRTFFLLYMKDRRTRTQHVLIQCRWSELSDDIMLLSNFIMNVLPNILKPSTMLLELLVQVNKLKVVCRWTGCVKSWWSVVVFWNQFGTKRQEIIIILSFLQGCICPSASCVHHVCHQL